MFVFKSHFCLQIGLNRFIKILPTFSNDLITSHSEVSLLEPAGLGVGIFGSRWRTNAAPFHGAATFPGPLGATMGPVARVSPI